MAKKNILILHPIGKWIGGGETGLLDLIKGLDKNRYTCFVVIPHKGQLSDELSKMNTEHSFLHIRRWHSLETKLMLPYLIFKLYSIVRRVKPAIIFCNSHDVTPFGVILGKIFNKPVVSFVGVELSYNLAKKYFINHTNAVIVKTDWQKKEIQKVKNNNIYNLKDGFNIEAFEVVNKNNINLLVRQEFKLHENALVLLSIGRFEHVKNLEYTLEGLKFLKDKEIYYIIVGAKFDKSPYEEHILNLIKSYGLEEKIRVVQFTKDLKRFFLASNVFIQSSKTEGLPRSVIEAMFYGLPVILSDIEPHKEILESAKGFLVPLDNPKMLAEKIDFFYHNMDKTIEYGTYNRQIAIKQYDIKTYIEKIEEIFTLLS